jgi:hypothetical protein
LPCSYPAERQLGGLGAQPGRDVQDGLGDRPDAERARAPAGPRESRGRLLAAVTPGSQPLPPREPTARSRSPIPAHMGDVPVRQSGRADQPVMCDRQKLTGHCALVAGLACGEVDARIAAADAPGPARGGGAPSVSGPWLLTLLDGASGSHAPALRAANLTTAGPPGPAGRRLPRARRRHGHHLLYRSGSGSDGDAAHGRVAAGQQHHREGGEHAGQPGRAEGGEEA